MESVAFQWGNLILGVVVVGGLFALIWWINRRKHGNSKPTTGAEAKAPEGSDEKRKSVRGKD